MLDRLLLLIKLASFRKIFKPTVANTGKCLPMLHLCSEGRSLAYKNKQENLGNNLFLKRDRPDSQHLQFLEPGIVISVDSQSLNVFVP